MLKFLLAVWPHWSFICDLMQFLNAFQVLLKNTKDVLDSCSSQTNEKSERNGFDVIEILENLETEIAAMLSNNLSWKSLRGFMTDFGKYSLILHIIVFV